MSRNGNTYRADPSEINEGSIREQWIMDKNQTTNQGKKHVCLRRFSTKVNTS